MKLKYYMRGLGIGMVVTAFILSVVIDKDTKTMSDDEVIARAKQLGMVESTVLSQMAMQNQGEEKEPEDIGNGEFEPENDVENAAETEPVNSENESESVSDEGEDSAEQTDVEESEADREPTEADREPTEEDREATEADREATEADREPTEEDREAVEGDIVETVTVTIVITPGESSESVSRSLEEAGLVESAKAFDKFLCDNGYDNVIAVGTYRISPGATEEEIAKIITKRK